MSSDPPTQPGLHRAPEPSYALRPVNDEPQPAWYDRCPTCGRAHEKPLFHEWWVWLLLFLTFLVIVLAIVPKPGG